jgi:putative lipoprotein (rSAM/lipoprotein system)
MAKKIIRLPGRMSLMLLRLVGTAITFLFTFFVYASGQVVQATASGRSTAGQAGMAKVAKLDSTTISPLYGIAPAYGIVEYGPVEIPYAHFMIRGTIKSLAENAPVKNAKVVLQDTTTKQNVDSASTASDGSFSMAFTQYLTASEALGTSPFTWILDVQDKDSAQGGPFLSKDTLISIPRDSLKGGSGVFAGADTVDIELYLQKASAAALQTRPAGMQSRMAMRAWRAADGTIEMRYALPAAVQTRLSLYDANGRLTREFFDRTEAAGEHEARLETYGLSAGIYFIKLLAGAQAAITKISIER